MIELNNSNKFKFKSDQFKYNTRLIFENVTASDRQVQQGEQ